MFVTTWHSRNPITKAVKTILQNLKGGNSTKLSIIPTLNLDKDTITTKLYTNLFGNIDDNIINKIHVSQFQQHIKIKLVSFQEYRKDQHMYINKCNTQMNRIKNKNSHGLFQ
jgi:hypothetical protein